MSKLFAIGDIHGCSVALNTLLESIQPGHDDIVIPLGDYVDRGPDTRGVLNELCDLKRNTNLIPLLGNHEAAMFAAFHSREGLKEWLAMGGDAVLRSYNTSSLAHIPAEHVKFLTSLRRSYVTENHFFVHANVFPEADLADQEDFMLLWEPLLFAPARHKSGSTMVCGHTPQSSGRPKNWGAAICVDTGAWNGGWLTGLEVRSGHYWQADEAGRTREGDLEPVFDEEEEEEWR